MAINDLCNETNEIGYFDKRNKKLLIPLLQQRKPCQFVQSYVSIL